MTGTLLSLGQFKTLHEGPCRRCSVPRLPFPRALTHHMGRLQQGNSGISTGRQHGNQQRKGSVHCKDSSKDFGPTTKVGAMSAQHIVGDQSPAICSQYSCHNRASCILVHGRCFPFAFDSHMPSPLIVHRNTNSTFCCLGKGRE